MNTMKRYKQNMLKPSEFILGLTFIPLLLLVSGMLVTLAWRWR